MIDKKPNPEALVSLLCNIAAQARGDAYAAYQKTGKMKYRRLDAPVTQEVIRAHLASDPPIACYFVQGEEVTAATLDLDDHDKSMDWADVADAARPILEQLRGDGMIPLCCRSGGGAGMHIWLFWTEPQKAKLVRQYLRHLLSKTGFKDGTGGVLKGQIEVYPKNDRVKKGGYGNALALPFARQSRPLNENLEPVEFADFDPPAFDDRTCPPVENVFTPPADRPKPSGEPRVKVPPYEALPGDDEEVAAALKLVSADDHDDWIRVGHALKQQLGDVGFDIWNAWSAHSSKYEGEEVCRERWEKLSPDGSLTVGSIFHMAKEKGWNGPSNPAIREMNARYGIYTGGRSTMILSKEQGADDFDVVRLIGKDALRDRLKAKKVSVPDGQGGFEMKPLFDYWMNHPQASHIHRIEFDPSKASGANGDAWNVWSGFAVRPAEGEWNLLEAHIRDIVADGDENLADWLLNWMALGVQQPGLVIGTAPVMVGVPGTGKGVLAHAYGRLWGRHFTTITHSAHVKGQFGAHFFGKRFIFIDEGMFSGDRTDVGVIKTRLTEPMIMIERKGVDAVLEPNRMIFMVASNERQSTPADLADRRWQMLQVSAAHREDKKYFGAIIDQLGRGGREAMLYDLLQRDIDAGPDPRRTIKTDALFEQTIRAGGPELRYIYEILDEGALPQTLAPGNTRSSTTVRALYDDMKERDPRAKHVPLTSFGATLRNVFTGVRAVQSGTYMARGPGGYEKKRSTRYEFKSLKKCRQDFELYVGQSVPWTIEIDDWQDARDETERGGKKPF